MKSASLFSHCLFIKSLLAASALALLVNHATAGTTWNGNAAALTGNWDTGANWEGTTPTFSATTDLLFRNTSTNNQTMGNIQQNRTVRSLTFNGNVTTGFEIRLNVTNNNAARTLTMGDVSNAAAITVNSGAAGNITIGKGGGALTGNLILANNLAVAQNSTSATLIIDAPITESGGARTLTKTGTGTLTLSGANTYTGATNVTGGTLNLRHATDTLSSSSAVTVDGATAILSIAGNSDTVGAVSLKSGGSITGTGGTLTGTSYAVESGSVSAILGGAGVALTKSTAGTVTLTGANTYTGTTTIQNGTLALNGAANRLAVAGSVILGDTGTTGKLVLGGTTTASQTLTALTTTGLGGSVVGGNASNSTLTLNIASSNTFAGTLGGAGTNENNLALTKTGAGTLTLSNTANTFTGQVLSDSGTIQVTKLENNGTASSVGSGTGSIRLGNDATATLEYIGTSDSSTNKVIQIGTNAAANTGSATILNNSVSGKLTFTAANFTPLVTGVTAARALTLGGSYTGAANVIQGVIQDTNTAGGGIVSLTKEGASTWQLSGANTYTGGTTVTTGTLEVNNTTGSGTGSGTVTVDSTLKGDGSITAAANNFVYINGTLQVGQTGATGGQDFSLTTSGTGSTIFGASSLLSFDLWTTTGTDQTGTLAAADVLRLFGDVSIAGTSLLKLGNPNALTFQPGDMFKVFDWAGVGTRTGSFTEDFGAITLAPGASIDSSNLYTTGTISIIAIPEPSRALLMMLGLAGLVTRRRRC